MTEDIFFSLMRELRKTHSIVTTIEDALGAQETALCGIVDGWGDTLISALFDRYEEWEDPVFDWFWELVLADKDPTDEQLLKFYKENI